MRGAYLRGVLYVLIAVLTTLLDKAASGAMTWLSWGFVVLQGLIAWRGWLDQSLGEAKQKLTPPG